ncbi:notch homolog 2 N-terminal-like protein A [Watersipora subatra]|uniref:notch homolog 2 N-terminal-like protein A n=1 Tax=Watersipora subatra TaxID=2589382 RepID=UPI00355BFD92
MKQAVLLGIALLATVYGQSTEPYFDSSICFTADENGGLITFIADARNACWYWQCRRLGRTLRLIPRQCPNGSGVSSFFGASAGNPCTETFDPNSVKFDCTRKKFDLDVLPQCYHDYNDQGTCKNNGVVKAEGSICTCDCTGTGYADWDCSKTQEDLDSSSLPVVDPNAPCQGGVPLRDWCADAGEPCLNGGRCINECMNYVCECVGTFTAGKNCEQFFCSDGVECLNGGTCSRGEGNADQFASCQCLPGFTGLMCELSILNVS